MFSPKADVSFYAELFIMMALNQGSIVFRTLMKYKIKTIAHFTLNVDTSYILQLKFNTTTES